MNYNLEQKLFKTIEEKNVSRFIELIESEPTLIDKTDENGYSPLQKCLYHKLHDCSWKLIRMGADLNIKNNGGKIALHYAAISGFLDIVKYLHKHGSPLSVPANNDMCPLHFAAYGNKVDVIAYFLSQGVDIDIAFDQKRTALHHAAYKGYVESIRYLLDHGADPTIKDCDDQTPEDYARNNGNPQAIALFESYSEEKK